MKAIILLFLVCGALSAEANSRAFLQSLKETAPFQVADYEDFIFRDWTDEELKTLCGTIPLDEPIENTHEEVQELTALPTSYDFRKTVTGCVPQIRDQAQCGSCYAFGAATTFQGRRCKKTGKNIKFSTQDIVSCCTTTHGCNGGAMEYAFDYFYNKGVVTEACYPYTSSKGAVAKCSTKCTSSSGTWTKYKTTSMHTRVDGLTAMKTEVYNNGPVEVMMEVYSDFYSYKSGVYVHSKGTASGLHAVTMLGWGVSNGVKYLLLQNSWGTTWGENGTFKIKETDASFSKHGNYGIAGKV